MLFDDKLFIFTLLYVILEKKHVFLCTRKTKIMKPGSLVNSHNTLSSGTVIRGDVFAEEDLRVDAKVDGNIECKGKVIVGNGGVVTGYIKCKNAELMGCVSGDMFVDGRLTLKASVNYSGDITARAVEVEPGAVFNGACRMVTDDNEPIG